MATSQQILREYLISLGYRVDTASVKKFDTSILRTGLGIKALSGGVVGLIASAQAFVAIWARSMEKVYYASRLAQSSASNLQALDFGARSIGLSSEQIQSSIIGMARALRLNPGLQGLIKSFGVKVDGRDMSDVAMDFLGVLKKMPFYQAAQYGNLFGIGPDELYLMLEGLDKMKAAAQHRKELADSMGLDVDAAAKVGQEYSNQLRDLTEMAGILKDIAAMSLAGPFQDVAVLLKQILRDTASIVKNWTDLVDWKLIKSTQGESLGDTVRKFFEGLGWFKPKGVELSGRSAARIARGDLTPKTAPPQDPDTMFSEIESLLGLKEGILDRIWAAESGRGKYMKSPAGAEGHMGWMPGVNRAAYGVKDPNDLNQAAMGTGAYLNDLLQMFGGDYQLALAAYNWGPGNVAKYGLNSVITPKETLDYVAKTSGQPVVFHMANDIKVVSPDPQAAGAAVGREQRRVGADLVRAAGVVQ